MQWLYAISKEPTMITDKLLWAKPFAWPQIVGKTVEKRITKEYVS
jgi:hypothetical protein